MTSQQPETSQQREAGSADSAVDSPEIEELQAGIEQTREELAATVDALTAKLDVKSRAQARLADTRDQIQGQATHLARSAQDAATDDAGQPKPAVVAAAGAALVVVVVLLIWSSRRSS